MSLGIRLVHQSISESLGLMKVIHTTPFILASAGPTILTVSPPKPAVPIAVGSPASQVLDDTTRKREVRLMKNRYVCFMSVCKSA